MNFCKYRFPDGPSRGLICGVPLIATCDRSEPSKPTEFKGIEWTKKNPQKMMMYPEANKQEDLCFWHQRRDIKDVVGRETEISSADRQGFLSKRPLKELILFLKETKL